MERGHPVRQRAQDAQRRGRIVSKRIRATRERTGMSALRLVAQFQAIQNKPADALSRIALIPTIQVRIIRRTVRVDY